MRVIQTLAVKGELNITAITQQTGLNHVRLTQQLEELKELQIIQEKNFGRIRIFRLNPNSMASEKLREFFKDWLENSNHKNRLQE